ncbi:hypothetical protein F4778DRAFT_786206 [Xylariomycetidae sp. FL2044]|nr:hypothetical protein F4778DRAFT_786206 [Xylariomycetidae sp. FL2044]
MCSGRNYRMACGHTLSHFKTKCSRGCTEPEGPEKSVEDTCANCNPSYRITLIRRRHAHLHAKFMEEFERHQREGDQGLIEQSIEMLHLLDGETRRAMGEATRLKALTAEDVAFPDGIHEMPETSTSAWVDGRCVWFQEPAPPSAEEVYEASVRRVRVALGLPAVEVECEAIKKAKQMIADSNNKNNNNHNSARKEEPKKSIHKKTESHFRASQPSPPAAEPSSPAGEKRGRTRRDTPRSERSPGSSKSRVEMPEFPLAPTRTSNLRWTSELSGGPRDTDSDSDHDDGLVASPFEDNDHEEEEAAEETYYYEADEADEALASASDSDSDRTIRPLRLPPAPEAARKTLRRYRTMTEDEIDEVQDVWLRIADQYDKGKGPARKIYISLDEDRMIL